MAMEAHPQNTALVCTGRNLPKLSQLVLSISGATNLIPIYSPTVVPNNNQNVADTKYPITILDNAGSMLGRGTAFFLTETICTPVFGSMCRSPRWSLAAAVPERLLVST